MSQLQTTQGITFPQGYQSAGVYCGIKKPGMLDLALIVPDAEVSVAGVFTQNQMQAAPVRHSRQVVKGGIARAVVVNSGNANCATGEQGEKDTVRMAEVVAQKLNVNAGQVIVASTGVIGVPLPMDKVLGGIETAFTKISEGDDRATAEAILTTDSGAKRACIEVETPAGVIRIGGIAKGAGMIAPNMATMLCFLTTDAAIDAPLLQRCLADVVDRTFNCISVDGDTSTSDSVFVLASGAAGLVPIAPDGERYQAFLAGLTDVAARLATLIVRDGEGATRVVEVRVTGARSDADARLAARTIMTSLLVKTMFHGAELNWGRLVAAAGRSGAAVDPDRIAVAIGEHWVVEGGVGRPERYPLAEPLLRAPEVRVTVDLGLGEGRYTGWTSDLGEAYVRINSGYLT